tara:strand:- start:6 stop:710 length:705 start_codon:yes stop_codon:yes gene_type:complete
MIVTILILVLILTTRDLRTPPPAITGLIATDASYVRHGQIDLVWNPSDAKDFAYYSIYASKTEITDVTELSPVGQINNSTDVTYQATKYWVDGLSLDLSAFMEDTEYWFAVTAVDLDGKESNIGTSVRTTIELMPPAPSAFIKLTNTKGYYGVTNYQPATITVPIGTTVSWDRHLARNSAPRSTRQHTVTSDTGLFHHELTNSEPVFIYTFTEAGVFGYYCEFHDDEVGTVIVE